MENFDVKLSCYMVEIYKGELRDLLLPKNIKERPKLEIKNTPEGQVIIKNVKIRDLNTMAECNDIFDKGLGGR